jgi:hypothetical protein
VIVVSVDGTADALDAVKQGLLAGTVAQYPDAMAYMAVEALVKKLKGETVPEKSIHQSSLSRKTTCPRLANITKTSWICRLTGRDGDQFTHTGNQPGTQANRYDGYLGIWLIVGDQSQHRV